MSFKHARDALVLCHDNGVIGNEEFCFLYDANRSKNPEFPYEEYGKFDLEEWRTMNVKRNFASIKKTSRCWQKSLVYPKLSPAARDP